MEEHELQNVKYRILVKEIMEEDVNRKWIEHEGLKIDIEGISKQFVLKKTKINLSMVVMLRFMFRGFMNYEPYKKVYFSVVC